MAQEIYYTSAPEGLRPGDRGFCTVAASAGISRALGERLEALSGYRHVAAGASPVAFAHWILQLEGREHHVLSRVCDAGLDYTQRTNSLAHHLVLDPSELAPAGPAWMIAQPGVMIGAWNGRVGAISRSQPLPRGDVPPSPCNAWRHHAGDAGWGGVVAEAMARSAWKTIYLIYDAHQPVLTLAAEAIALLPPGDRWKGTFNTYFTSLPGGVTCQLRCCLAGTPAAAAASRGAGNGLLLDLTQPHLIPTPDDSPWVEAARAGRLGTGRSTSGGGGAIVGAGAAGNSPAAGTSAGGVPTSANRSSSHPAAPLADAGLTGLTLTGLAGEPGNSGATAEAGSDAIRGDSAAADPAAADSTSTPASAASARAAKSVPYRPSMSGGASTASAGSIPLKPTDGSSPGRTTARRWRAPLRAVAADGPVAPRGEISWAAERRRARQRMLMAVYALAVVALAAGVGFEIWANRASSDNPLPAIAQTQPTVAATAPSSMPSTAEMGSSSASRVSTNIPTTVPVTVVVAPKPPPAPAAPPPRPPPTPVTLDATLPAPGTGGGVRNVVRVVTLPDGLIQTPADAAALAIEFPGGDTQWSLKLADFTGTFSAKPAGDAADIGIGQVSSPGFTLLWRDASDLMGPATVASVTLDPGSRQVSFTWNVSFMLKRPKVYSLGYWVLQNSTMVMSNADGTRAQRISFKPLEIETSLLDPSLDATWPSGLPAETRLNLTGAPGTWQEGDVADLNADPAATSAGISTGINAALNPSGNAAGGNAASDGNAVGGGSAAAGSGVGTAGATSGDAFAGDPAGEGSASSPPQVLVMEKPLRDGAAAAFEIKFSAPDRVLQCDLKQATAAAAEELKAAALDLKAAKRDIENVTELFDPGLSTIADSIKSYEAMRDRVGRNPLPDDLPPDEIAVQLAKQQTQLDDQAMKMRQAMAPLTDKQSAAEDRVSECRRRLAAYKNLKRLEFAVRLPGGLTAATLRMVKD